MYVYIFIRAVSVNALIYAINLAALTQLTQLCLLPVFVLVFTLKPSVKPRQYGLTLFLFLKQLFLRENKEQKSV